MAQHPKASANEQAKAKLTAKIIGLRKELDGVIAARLKSEARGEHLTVKAQTPADRLREAALKELNGSAQGKQPKGNNYQTIISRQEVLEHALLMANGMIDRLNAQIKDERGEARAEEYAAAMTQWALALVAVERASQTVDELCRGTFLQPHRLPGLGRLANTHSAIFVALDNLRGRGLLTKRDVDLDQELARARDADPNR
jgi:hypothetical protein